MGCVSILPPRPAGASVLCPRDMPKKKSCSYLGHWDGSEVLIFLGLVSVSEVLGIVANPGKVDGSPVLNSGRVADSPVSRGVADLPAVILKGAGSSPLLL